MTQLARQLFRIWQTSPTALGVFGPRGTRGLRLRALCTSVLGRFFLRPTRQPTRRRAGLIPELLVHHDLLPPTLTVLLTDHLDLGIVPPLTLRPVNQRQLDQAAKLEALALRPWHLYPDAMLGHLVHDTTR